jgi:hypothetical protein
LVLPTWATGRISPIVAVVSVVTIIVISAEIKVEIAVVAASFEIEADQTTILKFDASVAREVLVVEIESSLTFGGSLPAGAEGATVVAGGDLDGRPSVRTEFDECFRNVATAAAGFELAFAVSGISVA